MGTARGQSEVVGSILLVAIIVIGVSTIGGIVLNDLGNQEEQVSAVVEGDITNQSGTYTVEFKHGGGDSVEMSDLTVYVRNESGPQQTFEFRSSDISQGDSDDRFEPGERWTNETIVGPSAPVVVTTSERVRLVLAHEPSETVLFDGVRAVG